MTAAKRDKHRVAIGLGANLGPRRQSLESAVRLLTSELGPLLEVSAWLETAPLVLPGEDASGVPNYLNGAALFETRMLPSEVMVTLRGIERELGRNRAAEKQRWQSRVIDLDLLAYDEAIITETDLVVPHPEMHLRRFVMEPFCEIWPGWHHPKLGRTARELLTELE